jgi:flagellar motility protein MotE (MotC chaperone)
MTRRSGLSAWPIFLLSLAIASSTVPAQTVNLTPSGELTDKSELPAPAPDTGQLISALDKRKADLDKRAEEIEQENQRLQALRADLNSLIGKYSQVKSNETIDSRQLEHLSKMYESMPPKDAALRIGRLKEPLALQLLSAIKPKTAARILNEMTPSQAARLTEKLAKSTPPPGATP